MTTALALADAGGNPPARIGGGVPAIRETMEALKAVRTFIAEEFRDGLDFGVIPGTGKKATLYKPGAEKACMYFNCYAEHDITPHEMGNGHVEYQVRTSLVSRTTGQRVGSGVGCCSSMETKYRYIGGKRKCPECGAEAIIVGKPEYGGGFVCFGKKGGCGAKYRDGDPRIVGQPTGSVERDNIHDVRNTVLKMAKKRSHVDAALGLGCLSELFTQDLEEDIFDIDAMPAPRTEPPAAPVAQNNSGHGRGSYASPDQTGQYQEARTRFLDAANGRFVDRWMLPDGSVCPDIREPLRSHQIDGHLLKWAKAEGLLDASIVPEDAKPAQVPKYVAIVFGRCRDAIGLEMNRYAKAKSAEEARRWRKANPDARPECVGFEELMEAEADEAIDAEFAQSEPAEAEAREAGSDG